MVSLATRFRKPVLAVRKGLQTQISEVLVILNIELHKALNILLPILRQ